MKKTLSALALACLCFAAQTSQAVIININAGALTQADGVTPVPSNSVVMVIASTGNTSFGALTNPTGASATAFVNEADDVILDRWGLDYAGGPGSTIHTISFNLGDVIGGQAINGGMKLILAWYNLDNTGSPASPGQGTTFGTYRSEAGGEDGSAPWQVPAGNADDVPLNMFTISSGGSVANAEGASDQTTFAPAANVPPTALCQNVTNSANGSCVANVTAAQVDNGSSDSDGTIDSMSLTPAGPYALGDNNVTLTVFDNQGASNSCSAVITVIDTTDPTVTCPANIVTNVAIGETEIVVNYSAPSASDACSNPVTVDSVPVSGTAFSIGVNTVNVTAVDAAGNTNTCSFTITVNGAGLGGCISQVDALTGITDGRKNSLLNALTKAQEKFNAGKIRQGCGKLKAFIIRAQVYKRVGILDAPTADALISCVQAQQVANGCP